MKMMILSLFLITQISCSDNPKLTNYIFQDVDQGIESISESGVAVRYGLDVLFVVDDSGSMDDNQRNLSENIDLFINGLQSKLPYGVEIKFAVTSGEKAVNRSLTFDQSLDFFTKVVWNGYPYCYTGPEIKESSCNWGELISFNASEGAYLTIDKSKNLAPLRERIILGSAREGNEAVVLSALIALEKEKSDPTGFLSEKNHLAIVAITDAEEQSQITPEVFLEKVSALKGGDESKIFPILIYPPAEEQHGLEYCPSDEDPAHVLPTLFEAFSNAKFLSLCDPRFGDSLSNLGEFISNAIASEIYLTRLPIPNSIKVLIDGVEIENDPKDGWIYKPLSNSIKIFYTLNKDMKVGEYDIDIDYDYFVIENPNKK